MGTTAAGTGEGLGMYTPAEMGTPGGIGPGTAGKPGHTGIEADVTGVVIGEGATMGMGATGLVGW